MKPIKTDFISNSSSTEEGAIAYMNWLIYRWKPKSAKSALIVNLEIIGPDFDSPRIYEFVIEVDYFTRKSDNSMFLDLSEEPEKGYEIRTAQGEYIFYDVWRAENEKHFCGEEFSAEIDRQRARYQ